MNIPQSYYPLYTSYMMPQFTTPIKVEEPYCDEVKDTSDVNTGDKLFSINIRPEIRKGCIWELRFRQSEKFQEDFPIHKANIIATDFEKSKNQMKNTESYLVLKIRSKLIEPIKEVPLLKVADLASSTKVEITNGIAVVKVKFTARPRNIFHKHADVMILVAQLYHGKELLAEDIHELIFRGGTGSIHSAENRKKNVLKKSAPTPTHNPMHYATQVMYPYTFHTPMVQNMTNNQAPQSTARTETLTVPELDEFDADHFFSDFVNNKGDSLAQYETNIGVQPDYTKNDSVGMPGFSFNVTGYQVQPNGLFQGTIEGMYMNKPFRGNFQTSITDTSLQGSFNAAFNQ